MYIKKLKYEISVSLIYYILGYILKFFS